MEIDHHELTVRIMLLLVCLVLLGGLIYYFIGSGHLNALFMQDSLVAVPVAQAPVSSTSLTATSTTDITPVPVLPTIPAKPVQQPAPSAPAAPALITITNAYNNATVRLSSGQEFSVNLGGNLNWRLAFSPATSVRQVSASSTNAEQGAFMAVAPGSVSLTATGAPICAPQQACPTFLAIFSTTLDIK